MTRPLALWLRFGAELALAAGLLALVEPESPRQTLPHPTAMAIGAASGLLLMLALARTARPPLRIRRERRRLFGVKALLLSMSSTAEEVVWRWFAIGTLAAAVGTAGAFIAATAGFAIAHVQTRAMIVHLLTGATFGTVYLATGSLLAAVAAHVSYNLLVLAATEAGGSAVAAVTAQSGRS
jgi:membrane protease YdiL (CAAX protease family)